MDDPGPPPATYAPEEGTRHAQTTGSERVSKEPVNQQVRSGPPRAATAALMSITKGTWDTEGAARLKATLTQDWGSKPMPVEAEEMRGYHSAALAPCSVRADDHLRAMTDLEVAILTAYLHQELELPHPPFFVNEVLPALQRTQLRQFHDEHLLYRLTATVPAAVSLPRGIAQRTLVSQLYAANTRGNFGQDLIRRLMDDTERMTYDGGHIITFVFSSRAAAKPWVGATIRLQNSLITIKDTTALTKSAVTGEIAMDQLDLCYTVKVLVQGEADATLIHVALQSLASVRVVEVARPIKRQGSEVHDNNYWQVLFHSTTCPKKLVGVTCIQIGEASLMLHHSQTFLRIPCFRCYNPRHSATRCNTTEAQVEISRGRHTRTFTGPPQPNRTLSPVTVKRATLDQVRAMLTDATRKIEASGARASPTTTPTTDPAAADSGLGGKRYNLGSMLAPTSRSRVKVDEPGAQGTDKPPPASSNEQRGSKGRGQTQRQRQPTKRELRFKTFMRATSTNRYKALEDPEDDIKGEDMEDDLQSTANTPNETSTGPEPTGGGATWTADEVGQDDPMLGDSQHELLAHIESAQQDAIATPDDNAESNNIDKGEAPDTHSSVPLGRTPSVGSATPISVFDMPGSLVSAPRATSSQLSHSTLEFEVVAVNPGMPAQTLDFWLAPFHGRKYGVPGNGNCLLLAYYASVTDCATTPLRLTKDVVRELQQLKREVYTLMMSNLLGDVELGLVDPQLELARLFPDRTRPDTTTAAIADLFTHYKSERDVLVTKARPSCFWSGATVLRALAQQAREPLYVIDELADGTTHIQRYVYKDFSLADGETHETGLQEIMMDSRAASLFHEYMQSGVIPPIIVLAHKEAPFYGVHHGALLRDWGNISGSDMRDRLDWVHNQMKDITLDKFPLNTEVNEQLAHQAERDIQIMSGYSDFVGDSQDSTTSTEKNGQRPLQTRSAKRQAAYGRILKAQEASQLQADDQQIWRELVEENDADAREWSRRGGREAGAPLLTRGRPASDLRVWLTEHPQACRSYYGSLRHPELGAKTEGSEVLKAWGDQEVQLEQVRTLQSLQHDDRLTATARAYCTDWVQTQALDHDMAASIAGDPRRWHRLRKMAPKLGDRSKPAEMDDDEWRILHLLPFLVRGWSDTTLGASPRAVRANWYLNNVHVRTICKDVVDRGDWSGSVTLHQATDKQGTAGGRATPPANRS